MAPGSRSTTTSLMISLKKSAGIAVQWLAPLGLFRFSYAFPMNADKGDDFRYEDEEERFQFSIGQAF